jgi:hypothetical protein
MSAAMQKVALQVAFTSACAVPALMVAIAPSAAAAVSTEAICFFMARSVEHRTSAFLAIGDKPTARRC